MATNTEIMSRSLIRDHEGFRSAVYQCPAGYWTLGYGRNVEQVGITEQEGDFLLTNDISACRRDLQSCIFWGRLNVVRRSVLIDMRYNLGPTRFFGFKKMLAALSVDDYVQAAVEMMDSRWAQQVPNRALRLSSMMRLGRLVPLS